MGKSCECCKRYWTHLRGKVKCFVTQMNRNSKQSIVIPESFVNYFAWKLSRTIKLEAPNGNLYDVGITERRNKTLLRSGWEAFVDANHIVENDSLMFRYCGSAHFKVVVFDSSGCEKMVSCAGTGSNISGQEPSTNSTDMSCSSGDSKTQLSGRARSDDCHRGRSGHCRKRAKKDAISSPSEDLSGEDSPYEHETSESDDRAAPKPLYVLSGQCYVTEEHEEEIAALVQETKPEMPLLVAMMTKPDVNPYPDLVIPKDYALEHFPHKNQTITLQLPGQSKKWHCEFCVRSDGGRCSLYGCDFVRDNHLLEGDLCLFQPMKKAKGRTFEVMVHLLRTAGEETFSPGHEEHGINEKSPNHDDTDRTCDLPYMMPLHARPRLTKVQEKKVSEKVGAIASELPIYVAVMTKSRVHVCLTFSTRYSATYLRNGSRNLVLQLEGKSQRWLAELHNVQGALRIGAGWTSFTSDNHLRDRDICLFQLMKNEGPLKMIVYIIRGEPSINYTNMSSSSLCPNAQSSTSSSSEESGECASTDSYDPADSHESLGGNNSGCLYKRPYILSSRIYLSQGQMKVIEEKVQTIQSDVPICISFIKKRKSQMEFCGEYAAAHLPRVNQTVVLQFMGKIWETKMVVSNCGRWYLCGGWPKFSNDNLLQVGDICLFELKKNERKLTMTVHLLRKAGEETFSPGHEEHGISEKSHSHDDTHRTCDLPYMMPMGARLTQVQEKKVLEKVGAIASELPIYVAVMTKSRVFVCLTFATRYSAMYLGNGRRNLVLQLEGKSQRWRTELYDVQGTLRMGAGWTSFTSDNHLREGDICLFQLVKNEGALKMIVYIIRESGRPNGFRSENSGHRQKRAKTAATSSSSEESGENASTDSHESLRGENSDRSSKRSYILPPRSRLPQAQMKVIEEKVQTIQSDVPIFISFIKKRKSQMEFCGEYAAAAHLPRVNQTVVLRFKGKIWETNMVVSNCGRRYLCGGWSKFADDNLLQVGDICLFELKRNERKLTMMVHIIFSKGF